MAETGTVRKVAFAAAESSIPTLPALGANISSWGSFTTTIGGQPGASDDAYLSEDSISVTPRTEEVEIDPPLAQNRLEEIVIKNGVDMFEFGCYSVNDTVFALDSTTTDSGNVTEQGLTITYRACVIEITGKGILYFPKVRVKLKGFEGAVKELGAVQFECKVFGTTTIPSGWQWHTFNG
jgi:hypothetical protein